MLAPTNGSTLHPRVTTALSQLQQGDAGHDHIILTTSEGSTSRNAPFILAEVGTGGLDALRSKLRTPETRFALLRVQARILLVVSLGQELGGLRRAQALVQARALQSTLGAIVFAALTIADHSQLTSAIVGSKLQLEGFAHIASPDIAQDFRSSWSSVSANGSIPRSKPSAPSSPEEVGYEAHWSRPISDFGTSYRRERLSALDRSRPHPVHSLQYAQPSERASTRSGRQGIVIDLESVMDRSEQDTDVEGHDHPPPLPPKANPPTLPSASNGAALRPHTASAATPPSLIAPALRAPFQLRKLSDPDRLSPQPTDERERVRIDEAIRDEVMKKLRAEQQNLLHANSRSPGSRTPRLAISPPLAPPPPFAPPPAPPSPLVAASSTPRHSSRTLGPASTPKRSDQGKTGRSVPGESRRTSASGSASLVSDEAEARDAGLEAMARSLSDTSRTSESHESLRSSIQSLNLWEFAEAASQRSSFLSLPSRGSAPFNDGPGFQSQRPGTATFASDGKRSRQPSYSESVTSVGLDERRCAPSSSRGSVAASSIFDKDLPAPPAAATETGSVGSGDWTRELDSPDSTHLPAFPWMESKAASGYEEQGRAKDATEEELQDLRERLQQAEARAKAAEEAAEVAVRSAQDETRRLAEELAHVERGTRDRMEAEAIRRAKWAKEQVARDQLDAFERSKLEADEKRRRRAIEEQRQSECERANRIREERQWREHEAERIKQEYELKLHYLAEREAKIKAEAQARADKERGRREEEERRARARQVRLGELKWALLAADGEEDEGGSRALLSGWLNVQAEGSLQWKRRWGEVKQRRLVLSKSATDTTAITTIPLERARLVSDAEDHEDCTMPYTLRLEMPIEDGDAADAAGGTRVHWVATESRAAKEDIELIMETIASM